MKFIHECIYETLLVIAIENDSIDIVRYLLSIERVNPNILNILIIYFLLIKFIIFYFNRI